MSCEIKQSVQQTYVETQSQGAVTEPVNGNWLQAYCESLGVTVPVNASWLVALCNHLGITEPLYASWTIALANYYGINEPVNGSWWNALACHGDVPTELVWDLTSTEWQNESDEWATAVVPMNPTFDQDGDTLSDLTPTFTGTSDPRNNITLTINGSDYKASSDVSGIWSITVTNELGGLPTPGQNYPVTIIALDSSNGLESAITNGSVNIEAAASLIEVVMTDTYGDGWGPAWIEIQKETSPGVWTSIEYEGNPYFYSGWDQALPITYYKAFSWGIYAVMFQTHDSEDPLGGGAGPVSRFLDLGSGNYQIVAFEQDPVHYPEEKRYTVLQGSTVILPEFAGTTSNWSNGYIQQTFTL